MHTCNAHKEAPSVADQINGMELFLSRHDYLENTEHRGWYVTRWLNPTDFSDPDNIKAWCKTVPSEPQTFPHYWHLPYNCAKRNQKIVVESYLAWLERKIEATHETERLFGDAVVAVKQNNWRVFDTVVRNATTHIGHDFAAHVESDTA